MEEEKAQAATPVALDYKTRHAQAMRQITADMRRALNCKLVAGMLWGAAVWVFLEPFFKKSMSEHGVGYSFGILAAGFGGLVFNLMGNAKRSEARQCLANLRGCAPATCVRE